MDSKHAGRLPIGNPGAGLNPGLQQGLQEGFVEAADGRGLKGDFQVGAMSEDDPMVWRTLIEGREISPRLQDGEGAAEASFEVRRWAQRQL